MKNVGELIREKRKQLEMKVYELAKKVGVDPVYITQIEKHNKLPSFEVFDRISKILNLDCRSLYISQKYPELQKEPNLLDGKWHILSTPLKSEISNFIVNERNESFKDFAIKIIGKYSPHELKNKTIIEFVKNQLEVAVNANKQAVLYGRKSHEAFDQIYTTLTPSLPIIKQLKTKSK